MSEQSVTPIRPEQRFECRHGCGRGYAKPMSRGQHERFCSSNPEAASNRAKMSAGQHRRHGTAPRAQGEVAAAAPTQQIPEVDTSKVSAIFLEDVSLRHLVDQFGPDAVIAPIGGGRGIGVLR